MAGCVTKIDRETPLPGGEKMIRGTFTLDSSYTGTGEVLNLANYLNSGCYPTVIVECAAGYTLAHNKGTASAGTIIAYQNVFNTLTVNGVAMNAALYQVHAGADLTGINAGFVAIGTAY